MLQKKDYGNKDTGISSYENWWKTRTAVLNKAGLSIPNSAGDLVLARLALDPRAPIDITATLSLPEIGHLFAEFASTAVYTKAPLRGQALNSVMVVGYIKNVQRYILT